jgi:two-component system sensor histidine kinase RegB
MILDQLNERNTFGIGDPCRDVTASELARSVIEKIEPEIGSRLEMVLTEDATWRLPYETTVQALIILIQNAAQADSSGAKIELQITNDGSGCMFEVIDSGPDPTTETLARASDPFFTTKPPGQGMGLGLFLVKCLAQRLHGEFTIYRSLDCRTHARLILQNPSHTDYR